MNIFCVTIFVWILFPQTIRSASIPHDEAWCYHPDNCVADLTQEILPEFWEGSCNAGTSQSPIDIQTSRVNESSEEIQLILSPSYGENHEDCELLNNGHTAEVILNEEKRDQMFVNGYLGSYKFMQLHFHWGRSDLAGSEHTINGKPFQMEMHLVHLNTKFRSPMDALAPGISDADRKRAMLVIALFVNDDGPDDNPAFVPITSQLKGLDLGLEDPSLVKNISKTLSSDLNIMEMLPKNMAFFEYEGSLTTPLCYEIVHWAVVQQPIEISQAQMQAFRSLRTFDRKRIAGNFRPIQPVNGRKITYHSSVKVFNNAMRFYLHPIIILICLLAYKIL